MPSAALLGNIEIIVVASAQAGMAPQPRGPGLASFFQIRPSIAFSQSNANTGLATLTTFGARIVGAQTPGFIAKITLAPPTLTPAIFAALINQNSLTGGGYSATPSLGYQTLIQGPPQGIAISLATSGLANVIAPSGSTVSIIMPSFYFPHLCVGLTSTQAGSLSIQRYIDTLALVPQGAPLTATLVGGTSNVVDNADGKAFGSFIITVTNTGGVNATLSGVAMLLLAR